MDDWAGIPLEEFGPQHEVGKDGKTTGRMVLPHGDGEAQSLLSSLAALVSDAYEVLLSEEEGVFYEREGKVPVLRGEKRCREYEDIDALTLQDLPAVLNTLVVLEEESRIRSAEEAVCLEERRRARRRQLDRERRQRKKLGEWQLGVRRRRIERRGNGSQSQTVFPRKPHRDCFVSSFCSRSGFLCHAERSSSSTFRTPS